MVAFESFIASGKAARSSFNLSFILSDRAIVPARIPLTATI